MSGLQEFIITLRPTRADMLRTGPTPRESEVIGRHFAYLQELCRHGTVVLAGRTTTTDESSFGICVFGAESRVAAEAIMRSDPAVAEGVMSAALLPFRVALLTRTAHDAQPDAT